MGVRCRRVRHPLDISFHGKPKEVISIDTTHLPYTIHNATTVHTVRYWEPLQG